VKIIQTSTKHGLAVATGQLRLPLPDPRALRCPLVAKGLFPPHSLSAAFWLLREWAHPSATLGFQLPPSSICMACAWVLTEMGGCCHIGGRAVPRWGLVLAGTCCPPTTLAPSRSFFQCSCRLGRADDDIAFMRMTSSPHTLASCQRFNVVRSYPTSCGKTSAQCIGTVQHHSASAQSNIIVQRHSATSQGNIAVQRHSATSQGNMPNATR
jgi:hypothetical protein